MKNKFIGVIAVSFVSFAFVSCGTDNLNKQGAGATAVPLSAQAQVSVAQLLGNYGALNGGTLQHLNFDSNVDWQQDYTITIGTTSSVPNRPGTYATVTFHSAGAHPIDFTSVATFKQGPLGNGDEGYGFTTESQNISDVSTASFALGIIVAMKGATIDPAQSSIRLLDCGSSKGVECTANVVDAQFVGGFGRR